MRINKKVCFYSVAPLSVQERKDIIPRVREKYNHPTLSGIPTKHLCEEIANSWPDPRNLCYGRKPEFRPCFTLCYICIYVLSELNKEQNKKFREIFGKKPKQLK